MERNSEEGSALDEEDGDQAASWIMMRDDSDDEEVEVTTACNPSRTTFRDGVPDPSADTLVLRLGSGVVHKDQEKLERMSEPVMPGGGMSEGQVGLLEPERDAPSVSPSSIMDTCSPSLSSLSSSSPCFSNHHTIFSSSSLSSSSSVLCLTPPLPPSVDLLAVLTDTKLTLDVYRGGAAALPLLWGSIPGQLKGLQYLRLGSEDKSSLDDALDVLPNLTELRSLAIRGIFQIYFMWY